MVTIESKNHSINLGGGGFICLRTKVAELAAPDIFEHYKKSMDGMRLYDDDKRKAFYKSYNAKIAELDKKYKGKMSNILDFLYESDCDGIMDVPHCRSIYKVIKDYDDDTAMPAEKTARNLLILKLSLKTALIPVMVSPGSKAANKKQKKVFTPDGGKGQNYENFSN